MHKSTHAVLRTRRTLLEGAGAALLIHAWSVLAGKTRLAARLAQLYGLTHIPPQMMVQEGQQLTDPDLQKVRLTLHAWQHKFCTSDAVVGHQRQAWSCQVACDRASSTTSVAYAHNLQLIVPACLLPGPPGQELYCQGNLIGWMLLVPFAACA